MKTKIFCISAMIAFSVLAVAQEYIPLLQEGNQWNVMVCENGGESHPRVYSHTNVYRLSGDTVIEGKRYLSLIQSSDKLQETWKVAGFLREDADVMKVYLREYDDGNRPGQEGVLYCFDVAVGDTVITIWPDSIRNIVEKVDFVEINGRNHRRITADSKFISDNYSGISSKNEWIEGIGHKNGILRRNAVWPGDMGSRLLAFIQNGETVYNPYNYDTDFIWWTAFSEPAETVAPITLSVTGYTLHVVGIAGSYSVDVFSVDGKHLLHRKSSDGETDVQLSALPSGIYIVKVVSDKQNVSSKIRLN
jgi:hypothetical protein